MIRIICKPFKAKALSQQTQTSTLPLTCPRVCKNQHRGTHPTPHNAEACRHMEASNNADSASLSMKIKETHKFFREGTNTAMFIDLHCNSTQTRQRLRGRESTQIQCHERVLYSSASRPAALQGHKFFREGTCTGFLLATLAAPPYMGGVRKRQKFCFTVTKTVFGQDEA